MRDLPVPDCPATSRITDCVAMAHVADVDRSVAFYALLGFECISRFSGSDDQTVWARVKSLNAQLMLSRASGAVVAADQAVLFYMYSEDVAALRQHLLSQGLASAGRPPGEEPPADPAAPVKTRVVFDISRPFYMPEGELRIHDPDGYCILVGQLG
jgi:catechol 2,3-dioxygenase-like lactoylglutathione lyase family enzyme